ncbi:MAG: hypothetical protein RIA63_01665, partial [Cyclobacteriaceae bacterium]
MRTNKALRYLLIVGLFLVGCQPSKQNNEISEENSTEKSSPLIGEWRNLTLRVELDKKQGEPSSVFEVDENTWKETLQIHPIRTYFRSDGSFNSEHFNLNDSLVLNPEGTWTATADEIVI